jgi:hypothetical protein
VNFTLSLVTVGWIDLDDYALRNDVLLEYFLIKNLMRFCVHILIVSFKVAGSSLVFPLFIVTSQSRLRQI